MKKETIKVLSIDDEAEVLESLTELLEVAGFDVQSSTDSEKGLTMVKDFMPDAIVLDIIMPKMDGYQFCRHLKEDADTKNIPVIFLTGVDPHDDAGRAFAAGGALFVKKPFLIEELIEVIKVATLATRQHYG
ncbi:MAG: response regulator [candidate division Zixibacteria bacterium]|jgi:CheY-like chemotaxis protein|nr:response regulator [candidate division Zixibacteria bacterium]